MPTNRERNKSAVAHLAYQDVTNDQQTKIDAMRKAGQGFAKVVIRNTEPGPESTLAQRHIEDALYRAIRSVIFEFADVDPSGGQMSAPAKRQRTSVVPRKAAVAPPAKKVVKRRNAA